MKTRKELGDTPVTGGYPNSPDHAPDPADLIEKQLDFLDPDHPDEADDACPATTYDKDPYALTAAYPPPHDNPLFLTNRTPLPPGAKYAAPIKLIKCPIIAYRSSNDMVIRGYFITDSAALHGKVPERAKKLCNNLSLSLLQVGSPTPISALIDPRAKDQLTEPLGKDILFAEKVWVSDGEPDADTWRE